MFNELFIENLYHFDSKSDYPRIFDCGSNIGMSVLYFKKLYPNAIITAFEPDEEAYLCLKENIESNRLDAITAHKMALSKKEGVIDFYHDEEVVGSLMMSTVKERMHKQNRVVQTAPLSKYIDGEIDFLKMDIEGAELEVLEELCQANKLNLVKQMVIEYHHHISADSDTFSRMLKLLEDAGFGYQIESYGNRPLALGVYQDILISAYRKIFRDPND
jgi:FkbM family methyltransferase